MFPDLLLTAIPMARLHAARARQGIGCCTLVIDSLARRRRCKRSGGTSDVDRRGQPTLPDLGDQVALGVSWPWPYFCSRPSRYTSSNCSRQHVAEARQAGETALVEIIA